MKERCGQRRRIEPAANSAQPRWQLHNLIHPTIFLSFFLSYERQLLLDHFSFVVVGYSNNANFLSPLVTFCGERCHKSVVSKTVIFHCTEVYGLFSAQAKCVFMTGTVLMCSYRNESLPENRFPARFVVVFNIAWLLIKDWMFLKNKAKVSHLFFSNSHFSSYIAPLWYLIILFQLNHGLCYA